MISLSDLTYIDYLAKFGVGCAHPGGFILTQDILAKENIKQDSKILDVGCGTGRTAAYLYEQFKTNVVGLEIHPIMLEKAEKRFLSQQLPIQLVAGSVENIPLERNMYDFVLSESVLAFVNKPSALAEIYRVLKPGGKLIANEMTIESKLSEEEQTKIKQFYNVDSLLEKEDWEHLLNTAGFCNIEIYKGTHDGYAVPEYNLSPNLELELFNILSQHGHFLSLYQDILTYRLITCTK
ncbi:class I SAM-dependent methyltransferase [Heyndrickxia ginsengihumi]|uniref:class I SAM-dependent methyltransferase n=1 Tax=Heyndrickxia ginsengihumi TaxID=363870 RepID=UPI003D22EA11